MRIPLGICSFIALGMGLQAAPIAADTHDGTPGPDVVSLLAKDLPEFPGKEATMATVEYLPGGASHPHRHHAHVFVYVLEGHYATQVAGGERVVLEPGQTFYENPSDEHLVSENASKTEPVKILVVMLKDKEPAK